MSELTLHKISYKDLREFKYKSFDDPYGIVAFMTDHLRETLLACPNNNDDSKTAMYLMTDDTVAVGRVLQFGTKLKLDGIVVPAQTGGSSYVAENYRAKGVGASLLLASKMSKEFDFKINALFSTMVVPMLRKLKYNIFEIPQYVIIRDIKPMLASMGVRGVGLTITGAIANFPIRCLDIVNRIRRNRLSNKYNVKKVDSVPEWAGMLATNDSSKYMEYLDREWLQWNLDYNMNGYKGDIQSFYIISDKSGNPMGFFMTKERFEETAGRYKNIIRGTIVEWGTKDSISLSESDIYLLAIQSFTPQTFHILTVTTCPETEKKLKRMGFFRHGSLQMLVGDKKKRYDDIGDIKLWRIRYGGCNTIIFGQTPNNKN